MNILIYRMQTFGNEYFNLENARRSILGPDSSAEKLIIEGKGGQTNRFHLFRKSVCRKHIVDIELWQQITDCPPEITSQ